MWGFGMVYYDRDHLDQWSRGARGAGAAFVDAMIEECLCMVFALAMVFGVFPVVCRRGNIIRRLRHKT